MTAIRRAAVLVVVALVALAHSVVGQAHSGGASYVEFSQREGEWHAQLDLPLADLAEEFALDRDGDGALRWGEVLNAREQLQRAYRERLSISHAGYACAGEMAAPLELVRRATGTHLRMQQRFGTQRGCGEEVAVEVDRWLAALADHGVYVTRATAPNEVTLLAGTVRSMSLVPSASSTNAARAAGQFMLLGIEHLLTGYDHLAFLMLLLLGIARGARDHTARTPLVEAAGIVSAFTVAHSCTLALAATGTVTFPAAPVEAAIAASIIATAVAVILGVRCALGWRVAFLFGLVHGLGFANLLGELLTGASLVLPLISFNVGLELAQLGVVLALFPGVLWLTRRPTLAARALPVVAGAFGALGAYWLIDRL